MLRQSLLWSLYVVVGFTVVNGDYDCICNYAVEKAVYPDIAQLKPPLGYLYEFDCKPQYIGHGPSGQQQILTIQFEKELGYISTSDTQVQICAGKPSVDDLIKLTTKTHGHTTTTATAATTEQPTTATVTETSIPTTQTTTMPATTTPTTMSTTAQMTTSRSTRSTTPTMASTTTAQTTTTPSTTQSTTTETTTTTTTTTTIQPITTPSTTRTTTQPTTTQPTTRTTVRPSTTTPIPSTTTTTEAPTTPYPYWSMAANATGTPYQYVGIGYNVLNANPDSNPDPGFLTSSRVFQLTGDLSTSLQEATYQTSSTCTPHTEAYLIHGLKAYQDELMNYVSLANQTAAITDAAFTYNINFNGRAFLVNDDSRVYRDVITTCKFGTVNYRYNGNQVNFTVSRDFASAVCTLSQDYSTSKAQYMAFLDKWGTSIVTSVDMGTRTQVRYQTTPTDLYHHVRHYDPDFIKDGGLYAGYASSVAIDTTKYQTSRAAKFNIGSTHTISTGTREHQIPIATHAVSILAAFDMKYWKPILDELVLEGYCSDSLYGTGLTQYVTNIKTALGEYATYKSTVQGLTKATLVDRPFVQVPLTWPVGTYGLMKSGQGCPSAHSGWYWSEGWRKFDTEDSDAHNYFSSNINTYLSGSFQSNDIITRFCMKIVPKTSSYEENWPQGSYCLLKDGNCPTGFHSGYIFWDNEDYHTNNGHGGTMPDGDYNRDTKIYFCCRNDGSPHDKIFLPTDRTFVLLRYSNICQSVNGMTVTDVYVRWDDEDTLNKSGSGGMHPSDTGGSRDHLLHFCYYKSITGGHGAVLIG